MIPSRFVLKPHEVPVALLPVVSSPNTRNPRGGRYALAPVCGLQFPAVWKTVAENLGSGSLLNMKHAYDSSFWGTLNGRSRSDMSGSTLTGNTAAVLRPIYLEFLEKFSYRNAADDDSEYDINRIFSSLPELCGDEVPRKLLVVGSEIAHRVYKMHPFDIQVKIAHYTALFLYVDDSAGNLEGAARERNLEDLRLFQLKMFDPEGYARRYPGRGDLHPGLEGMMAYLRSEELHPFGARPELHSMMVRTTLNLFEACIAEQHYESNPLEFTADMLQFPRFLRLKSGLSEVFAHFVILRTSPSAPTEDEDRFFYNSLLPMVPDLIEFIDIGNDILSFYKEAQDGETALYLLYHASVNNMNPVEAFRERVDNIVRARNRVVAMAEKAGSVEHKSVEQFFQGYIRFHVMSKRYRLHEVLGETYSKPTSNRQITRLA